MIKKIKYKGTVKKTFTIKPKSTSLKSVTSKKKKSIKVIWNKQATQTTGYEIQYATNSKFTKNKKTVTVSKNKTTSKTISKLKANKKYYVRVRTYKTVNGKKYYSSWSKYKTVKTK
ncbi:MAG: fibronectin type III domain-containing protein [Eubacterium sp.]|nr:fibronectin type III domain-containing protein [Eubacterium sp.]